MSLLRQKCVAFYLKPIGIQQKKQKTRKKRNGERGKNDPWKIYYYSNTIKTNEIEMRMTLKAIETCRIFQEWSKNDAHCFELGFKNAIKIYFFCSIDHHLILFHLLCFGARSRFGLAKFVIYVVGWNWLLNGLNFS